MDLFCGFISLPTGAASKHPPHKVTGNSKASHDLRESVAFSAPFFRWKHCWGQRFCKDYFISLLFLRVFLFLICFWIEGFKILLLLWLFACLAGWGYFAEVQRECLFCKSDSNFTIAAPLFLYAQLDNIYNKQVATRPLFKSCICLALPLCTTWRAQHTMSAVFSWEGFSSQPTHAAKFPC